MNKEALTQLADFLESEKYKFDMSTQEGKPACGTAGCIIGHAAFLWPQFAYEREAKAFDHNKREYYTFLTVSPKVEEMLKHLDLPKEDAERLFCIADNSDEYSDEEYRWQEDGETIYYAEITRKGAVATLRRFIDTGEILWFKGEQ